MFLVFENISFCISYFCCMRSLLLIFFLSFCSGSKGDPIYHQDFEGGNASLPAGFTSYHYVTGDPNDGQYTVSDEVGQDNGTWHPYFPQNTISGGKAIIVNASYSSGQFFRTSISGLCQNTTYEFSAYLMNVYDRNSEACPNGGIPVNVRFEIWDETESFLLKEMSTGNVSSTSTPRWEQFGLTFQSGVGQEAVILKMFNNGDGGCGNDLAIDDVVFRSCGDLTEIHSAEGPAGNVALCEEDLPANVQMTAVPDNSVYSQHYYQWQKSSSKENWQDIQGENSYTYFANEVKESTYFRVKVAEDPSNLNENYCSSASAPFLIEVVKTPGAPKNNGDIVVCSNEPFPPLSVTPEAGETINWFDQLSGGNLLAENTSTYHAENAGTFYAEAVKEGYECEPGNRAAVSLTILPAPPNVANEILALCKDTSLSLDAGLQNKKYLWSTGQTTRTIEITKAGEYFVEISNQNGCSVFKKFEIFPVETPEFDQITSEEKTVVIALEQEGEFEFSLDGRLFQESNIFHEIEGGIYTAYVRDKFGCQTLQREFVHLVIPKFITPNNDGYNDIFELKGISFFGNSEVRIFNRYGKLIKAGNGSSFKWDGKMDGKDLPADDYWYQINSEGFETIKGNFSLLR